jgi:hypothetical protein
MEQENLEKKLKPPLVTGGSYTPSIHRLPAPKKREQTLISIRTEHSKRWAKMIEEGRNG